MKTEKPTRHRLLKEAKKGKSFVSKDLTATMAMGMGVVALTLFTSLRPAAALYRTVVDSGFRLNIADVSWQAVKAFLQMAAPLWVVCTLAIVAVSLLQSRGIIAVEAVRIDLNRLNPVNGVRNLFSLKVLKGAVTAVLYLLLGTVWVVLAWSIFAPLVFAQIHMPATVAGVVWLSVGWRACLLLLATLSPIALGTAFVEFVLFIREMRMDKSEVKQEQKDHEGNPEIKNKRKETGQELSGQIQSDVRNSSMILANPTHIAVGIYVHPDYPGLQFVSVRERGARARSVIALAEHHGVVVVRDVAVARAVYASSRRYGFVSAELTARVGRLIEWLRDVERRNAPDIVEPTSASENPDAAARMSPDGYR